MSDVASIIIGGILALIALLMACGAVIGFVWRMYNKIEEKHTASSKAQHLRLDKIFDKIGTIETDIAVLKVTVNPHAAQDD